MIDGEASVTYYGSDSQPVGYDPFGGGLKTLPQRLLILHIRYLHCDSITVAKLQL